MAPKPPVDTPPRFGTSAVILNGEGKILAGQRFGSHGAGSWQLPGGHVEADEGLLSCAARETKEETDLDVEARRVVATTYDVFEKEGKHYITWFVLCELRDPHAVPKASRTGSVEKQHRRLADTRQAMEPAKCPRWLWKTAEELKGLDLFLPLVNLFKQTPGLDDIVRGSAPLVRLKRDGRHHVVSVKWDAAPVHLADAEEEMHRSVEEPRCYALDHGAVSLSRGADLVLGATNTADHAHPLEVLVVDPVDNSETVAWPLGDDTGVVVPPDGHEWELGHLESIKLSHIVARLPRACPDAGS
ncbi:Nudix hydrolase 1 [Tolypocladium capitatum]|uniref:Nudix hydrolase 1 n=1 Tax=Tolypocladium capitatum TaxID=45235 RepID=A0A2K3QDH9_9HYPO|nr:Nudix hydrolase 1 [Tolypocladium capitatum]